MVTEAELRDRLHSAAYRVGPGSGELASADAVITRRRTERRQRAAVLGAALCVLVVAVLVPVVGAHRSADRAPSRPASPAATSVAPLQPNDRWLQRTRGSLAGDAAFLAAARKREWQVPEGTARSGTARTVVFAGDVDGIRWVLVAGEVAGRRTGQWFTGLAGDPLGMLTADGLDDLQNGFPVGHVRLEAAGASLLVLTAPGDEVQVSPAVIVTAGGQVHRDYTPVPVADGVAIVHEKGPYAGAAIRFRVLRGGAQAAAGGGSGEFNVPSDLGDAARQTPRRPSVGTAPPSAVMNALQQILSATGLAPADVHPVLLWTGPLLVPGTVGSQGVVLALTMPSGAVVTTTAFGSSDAALPSGVCGSATHPAGTPLDSLVVIARCDTTMSTGGVATFVVSAPSVDKAITLRMADGSAISQHALVTGGAAVPDPGAVATVSVSGPSTSAAQIVPTDFQHDIFNLN
jgi:hypothetical protein